MHGLVEPQAFDVGPVEAAAEEPGLLAGELVGIVQRDELHEPGVAHRLHLLEECREREPDPRDDHGPRLDAAERVDALLEREHAQQLVDVVGLRLADEAIDLDRPRSCLQ